MNKRLTLKQLSVEGNKITLQNVLDILKSYGGIEAADSTGDGDDCFGVEFMLDDPDFTYDITVCYDGTVIESILDENEQSSTSTFTGLSINDVVIVSGEMGRQLIKYQDKLYATSISPFITDLEDNYIEYIQLGDQLVIVGTYNGIITDYVPAKDLREQAGEEIDKF